jgi:site-specific recombinase
VVSSMQPLLSGTIYFATLTGVFLWLSSVAAGWLDNWVAYRRIPEAIAQHRRLIRIIGKRRAARLAAMLEHGVTGFGGNVALGFLLGMAPIFGAFFGVPTEVRHVTLSTGSLTLAGLTYGAAHVKSLSFLGAVIGVAIIGVLNFGVSFVLALAVALRARGAFRADSRKLLKGLIWGFFRSPLQFFIPPLRAPSPPVK